MKRKVFDILITFYISFLMIYLNLANLLRLYGIYTTQQLSESLVYFGVVGLIVYLLCKIMNKLKLDIYDLIMFLLCIFGILSTIYAIKPDVALYGFNGRFEGLLQIITYYILFLNCKSIDNDVCKKNLVWIIIILGCCQSIYAILQFSGIKELFDYSILIKRKRIYSTGFEVNPNFLGTLMVFSLSLSLGMYFGKKNILVSALTLMTSTILFFGMLCSGAMSAMVAFFVLFLILCILFFVLKFDFRFLIIKIILIVICFFCIYSEYNKNDEGYYLLQIETASNEMKETLMGNAKPIYGSGRIHIWQETLKIVPDNLLNGVGIDNFYYAFGEDKPLIDVKSKLAVDKAHNEYLQKLVTEGIFSFLIYVILLVIIFIKSLIRIFKLREKIDSLFIILFLGFVSYCVQAFFNISVISIAPLFYVVMGLLCSLDKKVENERVKC